MTLQDLGSIGEFVGAILLFASLVYVGIQIRQNNQGQHALIRQNWSELVVGWNRYLIENRDLHHLVLRGLEEGFSNLDEIQSAELGAYYQSALWSFSTYQRHYENRLIDDQTWREIDSVIELYCESKAFKEFWPTFESRMSDAFRTYMEKKLEGVT